MVDDKTEILVAIARLEGKVDGINRRMDEHLMADTVVHTDHEKRLRYVERAQWKLHGLTVAAAAALSGGIGWFFKGGA
jgi:hypothetical protein